MIRRPPRSTLDRSSAASDVYKRQGQGGRRRKDGAGNLAQKLNVSQGLTLRAAGQVVVSLLYTSPSPRDRTRSRMPSSA